MTLSIPACRAALPVLLAAAGAAAAQAPPDATACVQLDDPAARLACYDRVHQRAAPAPAAAAPAPTAPEMAAPTAVDTPLSDSMFDERWDLDGRRRGALFEPRAYKPVYLLPVTWTDRVNTTPTSPTPDNRVLEPLDLRATEVKYQVSFKAKLAERIFGERGSLWAGYTQSSRWQVYAGTASRPFRETNYEPEVMFGWPLQQQLGGWHVRHLLVSLNHQSNGRSLPLSRSWNRVIATLQAERGDWTAEFRPWLRLREEPGDDDNPDIEDHVGRAELQLTRRWRIGERTHIAGLQLRHSLRGGDRSRGSAQLEWEFPIDGALRAHLQWFSGYGESLIDYNLRQNKLGLGISIVGWR